MAGWSDVIAVAPTGVGLAVCGGTPTLSGPPGYSSGGMNDSG